MTLVSQDCSPQSTQPRTRRLACLDWAMWISPGASVTIIHPREDEEEEFFSEDDCADESHTSTPSIP
jgi:hypothetical protein